MLGVKQLWNLSVGKQVRKLAAQKYNYQLTLKKKSNNQKVTNPPKTVVLPSANIGTSSCGFIATNLGSRCSPLKTLTSVNSQGILCWTNVKTKRSISVITDMWNKDNKDVKNYENLNRMVWENMLLSWSVESLPVGAVWKVKQSLQSEIVRKVSLIVKRNCSSFWSSC